MEIKYFDVFIRGWERMKQSLFSKPFNLDKWFAVGFTAFLANLAGGPSGGFSNSFRSKFKSNRFFDGFFSFPDSATDWMNSHPTLLTLIIIGILLIIGIVIVLLWLGSRGKFMFLHNVVYNKDDVKKPWNEYKKEGDSLFVWRLIFGLIVFSVSVFILIYGFIFARSLYYNEFTFSNQMLTILSLSAMFSIVVIITAYISLFLNDFIVPIMYKHRLTTTEAWTFFLPVLKSNIFHFLLYGIFILFLWIIFIAAIVVLGLVTCCIGFLVLAIPYIGTVILLPVHYTFRALSVEFLEQFGDEFTLFPKPESDSE